MKIGRELLFTANRAAKKALVHRASLLRLRGETRNVPPGPWGYTWGYFSPGCYGSAVISSDIASVSTPTSGTINSSSIAYCRAPELRVPRSAVGRPEPRRGRCGAGSDDVLHNVRSLELHVVRGTAIDVPVGTRNKTSRGTGYEHDNLSNLFWRSQTFQRVSLNDCLEKLRLAKAHPIPKSTRGKGVAGRDSVHADCRKKA